MAPIRKVLIAGCAAAVLGGLAVYSYLSPSFALDAIKSAAEANDTDRLRQLVDFDSVKTSLKEDLKAQFVASTTRSLDGNPFAAFGLALVTAMIDPMVEAIVSPASIAAMATQGRLDRERMLGAAETASDGAGKKENAAPLIQVDREYVGYSLYRVKLREQGKPQELLSFVLRREGFFSWRLSRISLPANLMMARLDRPGTSGNSLPGFGSAQSTPPEPTCQVSDIGLDKIQGRGERNWIFVTGRIVNNCALATGVQIKVTLYDAKENIAKVEDTWPASTNNIPAKGDFPFETMVQKVAGSERFEVRVIAVRSWGK